MKEVASHYLFLNMAIKNLELDLDNVMTGSFKIEKPYINIISNAIIKAKNERRKLNKVMYDEKIKVEFLYREGDYSHYNFHLDGKVKEVIYFNPIIKKNVEELMNRYLKEGN